MKNIYSFIILLLVAFVPLNASAQQKVTVSGKITDKSNAPLIGANVTTAEGSVGVTTDIDGNYQIAVEVGTLLNYNYLGYEPTTRKVESAAPLNVAMEEESQLLNEVVVVGYGTLKRSDLTGSVASIKDDVFTQGSGASLTEALSGKVAGMEVLSNSGVLGGESTIRIRGTNSMGNSEPLYIIDGVDYDNSAINGFEEAGSSISPLSMLNPSDIESMEVLKDASATAIYGSRGSNGVVIITTKMGKAGRARVTADVDYSVSKLTNYIDLLSSSQIQIMKNEASLYNGGTGSGSSEAHALAELNALPTTDWQDEVFQMGNALNASLSIAGGSESINYMVSANAYDAEGIIPSTDFMRLSGRVNLDFKINDKLKFGTRTVVANIKTAGVPTSSSLGASSGSTSVITRILRTLPSIEAVEVLEYDPDNPYGLDDEEFTPSMSIAGITQQNESSQTMINMFAEYKILPDLTFKATANIDERTNTANYYQSRVMPTGYDVGGMAKIKNSSSSSFSQENTLSYRKRIGRNHNLNVVFGNTFSTRASDTALMSVDGFPNDDMMWEDISSGTNVTVSNSETESVLLSWFGRANYTLMNKYIFTFTGRADGSSKFAEGNKWGFFPAAAVAWRISQEDWMRKCKKTISNLKLRASYGATGNQSLGSYATIASMNSQSVIFGSGTGSDIEYTGYQTSSQLANSGLKWETTYQADLGFDMGLFRNRVEITADVYQKDTKDLLVGADIGNITGFETMMLNYGEMRNRGLEFSITGRVVEKKDFSVNLSGTIGFNKSVLTELAKDYFASGVSMPWNGIDSQILIEGEELGIFWGYQRDGIMTADDVENSPLTVNGVALTEGEQRYVDTNDDGIIDDNDKSIIGHAQADFTYGFGANVKYKNLDFTVNFDGSYGNDICNMNSITGLQYGTGQQYESVWEDRWTEENPSTENPKLVNSSSPSAYVFSDRIIEDGSYLRLQNVTVGYSLPRAWLTKLRMTKLRVYVSCQNLVTFTKYSGYSPCVSYAGNNTLAMGHDYGAYPNPLVMKAGLNIGF